MTNTVLLNEIIEKSGLKKSYIAKQLGISAYCLAKKIRNENDFKTKEVDAMCKVLGITSLKQKEEIFFAQNVDK